MCHRAMNEIGEGIPYLRPYVNVPLRATNEIGEGIPYLRPYINVPQSLE